MKPFAYAVSCTLLIAAACINGFVIHHLFKALDHLSEFAGMIVFVPLTVFIALGAFGVIMYGTKAKPFSVHPLLSSLALANVAFPIGKFVLFLTRAS
jgi:hypothetical protein